MTEMAGAAQAPAIGNPRDELISSRRVTILQTENPRLLAALISISLSAVALRAIWLLRPGELWAMTPDSVGYLALAHGLLQGCGFAVWTRGTCGLPETMRTPGYPFFVASLGCSWRAVLLAQAILG